MSLQYIDVVTITPVTITAPNAEKTEGTPFDTIAYCELEDVMSRGANGTPISPRRMTMLPATVSVKKGDFIAYKKLSGDTVTGDDAIRREVVVVFKPRGIAISHLEVFARAGSIGGA